MECWVCRNLGNLSMDPATQVSPGAMQPYEVHGKLDDCVPFTAGAFEYSLPANTTAAAWEY